jgi:predicted DNA-binding protein (MmcQ/YjbR family)
MNKEHWLTILLDGSAEDELVKELFEISFDMTDRKSAKQKREPKQNEKDDR